MTNKINEDEAEYGVDSRYISVKERNEETAKFKLSMNPYIGMLMQKPALSTASSLIPLASLPNQIASLA